MLKTLKIAALLLFSLFFGLESTGQDYLPSSTNQIIKHTHYILSYSEEHEQAEWVVYKLTKSMLTGGQSRTDNFQLYPEVITGSATLADYKGSGYDRGHLCPAGDMTSSYTAMSESFFMSNKSPQEPSFNRGIWKKLESVVRSWAAHEQEIVVVTGPIFDENKGSIGTNSVTIPGYYFKIIYDVTDNEKMIGFILQNRKGELDLKQYAVSVDKVESVTGIDFFYKMLPDNKKEELESNLSITQWNFTEVSTSLTSSSSSTSTSIQCKGKDKAQVRDARIRQRMPMGIAMFISHKFQDIKLRNQKVVLLMVNTWQLFKLGPGVKGKLKRIGSIIGSINSKFN